MSNYYQDFVGLNIFSYEPVGWDADQQSLASGDVIVEGISTIQLNLSAYNDQFPASLHPTAFIIFGYATQNTIGNYFSTDITRYGVLGTNKNFFMDLRIEVDKPKTNPLRS